jgi:hypothetical protein
MTRARTSVSCSPVTPQWRWPGAEHEANLRIGMGNRAVIGQAKGILMERHRLTAEQAFGVLPRVSQEMNRKLFDIARELTDTGAVLEGRRHRD